MLTCLSAGNLTSTISSSPSRSFLKKLPGGRLLELRTFVEANLLRIQSDGMIDNQSGQETVVVPFLCEVYRRTSSNDKDGSDHF